MDSRETFFLSLSLPGSHENENPVKSILSVRSVVRSRDLLGGSVVTIENENPVKSILSVRSAVRSRDL